MTNGLGSSGHSSVNGKKFSSSGGSAVGTPVRHPLTSQLAYIKKSVFPSMYKHQYAWPFHRPVDVVKLNLPVSDSTGLLCRNYCSSVQFSSIYICIAHPLMSLILVF